MTISQIELEDTVRSLISSLEILYAEVQTNPEINSKTRTAINYLTAHDSNFYDANLTQKIYSGLALFYHPDKQSHCQNANATKNIKIINQIKEKPEDDQAIIYNALRTALIVTHSNANTQTNFNQQAQPEATAQRQAWTQEEAEEQTSEWTQAQTAAQTRRTQAWTQARKQAWEKAQAQAKSKWTLNQIQQAINDVKQLYNNLLFQANNSLTQSFDTNYQQIIKYYTQLLTILPSKDQAPKPIQKEMQKLEEIIAHTDELYEQFKIKNLYAQQELQLSKSIDQVISELEEQKIYLNLNLKQNSNNQNYAEYQLARKNYYALLQSLKYTSSLSNQNKTKIEQLKQVFEKTEYLNLLLQQQTKLATHIDQIVIELQNITNRINNYHDFNEINYKNALTTYEKFFTELKNINPNLQELYKTLHIADKIQQLKTVKQYATKIVEKFKSNSNFHNPSWLTPEQIKIINHFFAKKPHYNKLNRKTIINYHANKIQLPCSVIKSYDGKLYALYNGTIIYKNIHGLAGKGTYERVKLAQSLENGRIIAAKIQYTNNQSQEHSATTHEECAQQAIEQYLGNPNIYSGTTNRLEVNHYTFYKFIEAETLNNYLTKHQNLPSQEKLEIILKVLKETQNFHAKGIVHGDLSFNNILYNSKTQNINIIDFSFAIQNVSAHQTVKAPYTIPYSSEGYHPPECTTGKVSFKTDIYSLGKWMQLFLKDFPDPKIQQLTENMLIHDVDQRYDLNTCIQEITGYLKLYNANSSQRLYSFSSLGSVR